MKNIIVAICCLALCGSAWAAASTEGRKDLLPLGSKAPEFTLPDVTTATKFSLSDFQSKKALVVIFICRHCPYVQHVKSALTAIGNEYTKKGIAFVAVSANDPKAYPEDAPESLKEMAKQEGFAFPFLFDETQETAKAYTAVATPDVFIFDKDQKLVYRGQFDDTRPGGEKAATGKDVRAALDALLAGEPVSAAQKPAVGCSIKWKR
jgi:peroxiredoxin